MGSAPENQAANVHHTSLVRVIRRKEAIETLSPRAHSRAHLTFGGFRVGDDMTRALAAGFLILMNGEVELERREAHGVTRRRTNHANEKSITAKEALS